MHVHLSENERALFHRIAEIGNRYETARARLLLLAGEGKDTADIAAMVNLSARRVRYWLREFEARRQGVFSEQVRVRAAVRSADTPPEQEAVSVETESEGTPPPPAKEKPPPGGVDKPRRKLRLNKTPGVLPDDPMSEAGRKILFYHFERMLQHEPGTRLGEDIEALHDMRVATRRMRAAFRVFESFYRRKTVKPHIKGLRATGRALGVVRDLDVFMEQVQAYQNELSAPGDGLEPLLETWQTQREAARAQMHAYLDSPQFARFVDAFGDFLATPGAGARRRKEGGAPKSYLVRHVVPRLIYERFEAVRSYDIVLDSAPIETLHALRIEFKRLRYALEFFEEVLGPEAKKVIKAVKAMQDHLGDLNDADVAGSILQTFVADYEQSQVGVQISERRSIDKVIQYMARRAADKHALMVRFPEKWMQFNREAVRRDLALAVAAL